MYQIGSFQRAELGPQRLPKLQDGFEGVLQVVKTWVKDGRRGNLFMCEMIVAQSNHPSNPVGQRVMWTQDLMNKNVCDDALFQWASACYGFTSENEPAINWLKKNMGEDMFMQTGQHGLFYYAIYVNQEQNPFTHNMETGQPRYVVCRVYMKKTQNNRDFRVHAFAPLAQSA